MASDFVRNIKGVRNIDILSPNITTENDLISTTDGEVYVVTKKGYKKITGVETKEIKQLKTDVSNVKIQSDTNTLSISDLTDDIEKNTSEIETLKKSTGNNTSEIETLKTTTETNTSDIEALKTTTDNNTSEIESLKNNKVLLYEGSASNTGDVMTLSQPYSDFTELKIKINRTGGNEIFIFDGEDDGTIPINHTNLFNSGSGYSVNEMLISRNSSTELKIYYQGYYDSKGETTDSSGITILKIWGVK